MPVIARVGCKCPLRGNLRVGDGLEKMRDRAPLSTFRIVMSDRIGALRAGRQIRRRCRHAPASITNCAPKGAGAEGLKMTDPNENEVLVKLQEERSKLGERLRLIEAEAQSETGDGPLTESPQTVRDQIEQVDRMIERNDQAG